MAESFSRLNKGEEIKEDTAYTHAQNLKYNYATLQKEYDKMTFDAEQNKLNREMEQKKINKDYDIAGVKYNEKTGEPAAKTYPPTVTTESVKEH